MEFSHDQLQIWPQASFRTQNSIKLNLIFPNFNLTHHEMWRTLVKWSDNYLSFFETVAKHIDKSDNDVFFPVCNFAGTSDCSLDCCEGDMCNRVPGDAYYRRSAFLNRLFLERKRV